MRIKAIERWKLLTSVCGVKYNFIRNYYVSNHGRIKNDEFIMSPSLRGNYYRVNLRYKDSNGKKKGKSFNVHRLVCEYFCEPNINNLPTVNHIDGKTTNNYYKNLEWASYEYQARHAYNLGLTYIAKGEDSHLSVITEEMARDICKYLEKGYSVTKIRELMNLSTDYSEIISRIRKRKTWKWLSKDYNFSTKPYPKNYMSDATIHSICKMISKGYSYSEIYEKHKKDFDKFKRPKDKYYEIKTGHSYRYISKLYY